MTVNNIVNKIIINKPRLHVSFGLTTKHAFVSPPPKWG